MYINLIMKNYTFLIVLVFSFSSLFANNEPAHKYTGEDPLKKAAKNSKLGKKSNPYTFCNPYKLNTMCRMIREGNYKAVESLISKGADINKRSVKLTPLMYAARHNKAKIARLLIANGANLHAHSMKNGYTALKWAELSNATEAYEAIYAGILAETGRRNR